MLGINRRTLQRIALTLYLVSGWRLGLALPSALEAGRGEIKRVTEFQ